jgi:hypothetical protein
MRAGLYFKNYAGIGDAHGTPLEERKTSTAGGALVNEFVGAMEVAG